MLISGTCSGSVIWARLTALRLNDPHSQPAPEHPRDISIAEADASASRQGVDHAPQSARRHEAALTSESVLPLIRLYQPYSI